MTAKKKTTTTDCYIVEFRGVEFEISKKAWKSIKVQKACTAPESPKDSYWALDRICLGHLDEYLLKMPNENGEIDEELGADEDTLLEFIKVVAENVPKN